MELNLKQTLQKLEFLKELRSISDKPTQLAKMLISKNIIDEIISDYIEIVNDLSLGGECIIELDKPRLSAVKEKEEYEKTLNLLDDI